MITNKQIPQVKALNTLLKADLITYEQYEQFLNKLINENKKTPKYYLEKVFFNANCNFTKQQILIQLADEYGLDSDKGTKLIKEWTDLGYVVNYNGIYSLNKDKNNTPISNFDFKTDTPF